MVFGRLLANYVNNPEESTRPYLTESGFNAVNQNKISNNLGNISLLSRETDVSYLALTYFKVRNT